MGVEPPNLSGQIEGLPTLAICITQHIISELFFAPSTLEHDLPTFGAYEPRFTSNLLVFRLRLHPRPDLDGRPHA